MCIFLGGLNQNATKDAFCTDQAGTGKLPFNNLTNTSIDKQKSTGGKDCLASLGSPQEGDNYLSRRMLTLEKTLEFIISRALPPSLADELKNAVKIGSPHNSWVACIKDEIKQQECSSVAHKLRTVLVCLLGCLAFQSKCVRLFEWGFQ